MTAQPRPNSLRARDPAVLLHPYTDALANERDGPLVITRGDGVHVWDEDGNRYIEGMGGLWCVSLGFGNERLAQAAADQIRRLSFYHGFNQKSHEPQIELAERLLAVAPRGLTAPMSKVFFCNSGSEANDTAIKLIWYYNNAVGRPDKKKIIGREKGYHGITVAAGSVTGQPMNHTDFDLPIAGFRHTDCPHYPRNALDGESEEDFATRMADNLERLILDEGPDTVAAFFAEPIMGAGGIIVPPETYFDKIQAVLRRHDILFVADEVITGFGRTGSMWGTETFGLQPDIVTSAKALSSGYAPISAVLMSERIYRAVAEASARIGAFGHGYTYSGHPVSAAVALETLKIYDEMDLVGHVRATAPRMQDGIRRFADHPMVGEVSGVGMLAVAELVADKETRSSFDPARKVGPYLLERALAHGLIIRALGDRIGFSPPLVITPAEIDDMYARFARALDDTAAWARDNPA
jgi:4-aminobutyrate--pyruvate transaminase